MFLKRLENLLGFISGYSLHYAHDIVDGKFGREIERTVRLS